ncbi:MAG: glutamate 5-kinase [Kiritimatiellae bacterium]|nr:glutamate 5-kinase [Kiritimatiellia bacterium]
MNLENKHRKTLSTARRVVIKIGTRVITRASGEPDLNQIKMLADQVARLHEANHELLIVSSGAVGAGIEALGMTTRPTHVPDLQMCAAVGQAKLMALYDDFFKAHRIIIGQVLLTRADFRHKTQLANAKRTMNNMLEHRVVAIINENDVVANDEIKATFSLGDNDQLASRVVKLVHADLLVIFSTVDGVLDQNKQRVPYINHIEDAYKLINPNPGDASLSKGGMESKLSAAKRALGAGCRVVIANGRQEHVLADIMAGKSVGTLLTKG